ncbi:phosphate ABC transporter permease PstA [Alloalcanivorax sp. C16-1]|uniref:phosphate ABC transporter permease PstA n=1 Tax=Alloalcanivorax sp. C16-1 TaxID=3390051 RepID=UPI003970720B
MANSTMESGVDPRARIQSQVEQSLRRRHAREKRFRRFGLTAVMLGLAFVAVLFVSIFSRGLPAFWQSTLTLDVRFDPAVLNMGPPPQQQPEESPRDFQQRLNAWNFQLTMASWNTILEDALIAEKPALEEHRRQLRKLFTSGAKYRLRDMVAENPSLIGQSREVTLLADAEVDVWIRGNIDRSLPDARLQLSPELRRIADELHEDGLLDVTFSTTLFTNSDSRSSPASAGLAGAFMGSLFMMLVVIVLAVPVGVASAIYLEEFAPKNRLVDLIEVNINNLAAVPSIVFGLLGASIFINWFRLPLSAPLVGGLVLSLMTLPTVIITTRSALKAVPPSIRQAALALGASRVQTVFQQVLPLAIPGILTGAIIGVAQALGETAPLLLIGMNAFVANIPTTPFEQSTALPVQIYLWQGNEMRNFFEARTSAAIIVLLLMMITLNAFAIWLRKKFERRW